MNTNFPSQQRLRSKHNFAHVFANPAKVSLHCFLALYRANTLGYARLGLVISKKKVARAVDRNTFKRIIRESFRVHKNMLKGLDIVVLLRSECVPLDKKELRTNVDQIWLRIQYKAARASL